MLPSGPHPRDHGDRVQRLRRRPDRRPHAARLRATKVSERCTRSQKVHATTSHTPDFLGLTGNGGVWKKQFGGDYHAGEGVIVGVIDTGFWPESPSFAPLPEPRPDQAIIDAKWHGTCDAGIDEPPVTCNNKVIGARWYNDDAASPSDVPGRVPLAARLRRPRHRTPPAPRPATTACRPRSTAPDRRHDLRHGAGRPARDLQGRCTRTRRTARPAARVDIVARDRRRRRRRRRRDQLLDRRRRRQRRRPGRASRSSTRPPPVSSSPPSAGNAGPGAVTVDNAARG